MTWRYLSRVSEWGAPGDLVQLSDGRVVSVYGYRPNRPGIRAKVSEDDGGSWDLGYPRIIEREPGQVLAIYYLNRADDPVQMNGGVRHFAQTVFTPD